MRPAQTKIAEQITEQKEQYFLSVKGKQQGFFDDSEQAFMVDKKLEVFSKVCYLIEIQN
jgi:hypothetical protein